MSVLGGPHLMIQGSSDEGFIGEVETAVPEIITV